MNPISLFGHLVRTLGVPLLVLVTLVSTGCEEDVVAVTGTDLPFSIYGVLLPQADTQRVLIFTIEDRLVPTPSQKLAAVVTSLNRQTGEKIVWADSLVRNRQGMFEHVFWAVFNPVYGEDYRLSVVGADGDSSYVDVDVPGLIQIELQPPGATQTALLPVLITGDVSNFLNVDVEYHYRYSTGTPGVQDKLEVISYDGKLVKSGNEWRMNIDLHADYQTMRNLVVNLDNFDHNYGVQFAGMEIQITIGNEGWDPPGGVFDPYVLVQPGTMENVKNGFGFVGAGYRKNQTVVPTKDELRAAGFRIPEDMDPGS